MAYPALRMMIDGNWVDADDGESVTNPADGSVIARLPHATRAHLDDALAAAERGFRVWQRTEPAERERIMVRAAGILLSRRDEIAEDLVLDQGKTLMEARVEVQTAHDRILWDASEGRRLYGRIVPSRLGLRQMVTRHPVGVVAAFTPWNYPLASPTRKVSGALSAGCSIILKAAEETPSGAVALVRSFVEAGVPDGVVNLVFGKPAEVSKYLIAQPAVRLVTFTGSVPVGKQLAAMAGLHMKPVIMELGGHAPAIVWEDADAGDVAAASVIAKARNTGQVCVAPTRFFVHERVYDAFVDSFAAGAAALKVGTGNDPSLQMGPLANERRIHAMDRFVADAVDRGARLVCGGKRIGNSGHQYPLTVIAEVTDDARAMIEEPFGPLALLRKVGSLDEAISRANSVEFGLSAYAFTDSSRVVARLSEELECGALGINHFVSTYPEVPFGGIKDSGYGREGGTEGLDCYTFTRTVTQVVA